MEEWCMKFGLLFQALNDKIGRRDKNYSRVLERSCRLSVILNTFLQRPRLTPSLLSLNHAAKHLCRAVTY